MKLGVVGTGMISQIVVPHFGEWGLEVAAVCATPTTLDEAEALAQPYGAQAFGDYRQMLAEANIDTVYIAVPNFLHCSFALQALEAGKHVIIEKPIASNATEAESIAAAAHTAHRMAFEAISTLHLPNFAKIRELLPRIGTIKIASCNYSQYSHRYDAFREGTVLPAFDPARAGGALMDLGLYNFHYLMGLFGEPKEVHYLANVERGIDTSGVATLDFDTFKAVSVCAKDCAAPVISVIEGTDGYILQTTPANNCGEVVLHLNDGTEERFDENPAMQWESEFRAYKTMVDTSDFDSCYALLDHSVAVSRVMTTARLGAGVRFPMDEA